MPRGGRRREPYYRKMPTLLDPGAGMAPGAPCAYDAQLKLVVHRYDCGVRICRCGEVNLESAHAALPLSVHERLHRL